MQIPFSVNIMMLGTSFLGKSMMHGTLISKSAKGNGSDEEASNDPCS